MFNINIDTVVLSFQISSKDRVNLFGWRQNPKNKKIYTQKTSVAFYKCDTEKHFLNMQFSLSKLQNGTNYKDYNWTKPFYLIDRLNEDLIQAIQSDSFTIEDGKVCRIDLNENLKFKKEKDADELIRFINSISTPRRKRKIKFEKTVAMCTEAGNNIELRAYRKDKDPAISRTTRKNMNSTVRLEFQFNQAKEVRKYFGTDNLINIVSNPELSVRAWNSKLEKYRLDAAVYNRRQFFKVARKIFRVKDSTFKKYKKIIEKGWKNNKLTISEKRIFQKLILELYRCGVTPSYCNVDVNLIQDTPLKLSRRLFKKIIRKIFITINNNKNENKRNENEKRFKNYNYVIYKRFDSS